MPSSTASPIKAQKAFPVSLQPCELCKKLHFPTRTQKTISTEPRPWSLDVAGWNNNLLFWEYYNIWLRALTKVYLFHPIAFSHYVIGLICRTWNWELGGNSGSRGPEELFSQWRERTPDREDLLWRSDKTRAKRCVQTQIGYTRKDCYNISFSAIRLNVPACFFPPEFKLFGRSEPASKNIPD